MRKNIWPLCTCTYLHYNLLHACILFLCVCTYCRILDKLCCQLIGLMIIQSCRRRHLIRSCQTLAHYVSWMRAYSVSWRRDWLLGKCHKLTHILTLFHRHLKPKIGDILLSIAPFLKVMGVISTFSTVHIHCIHTLRCILNTLQTLIMLWKFLMNRANGAGHLKS